MQMLIKATAAATASRAEVSYLAKNLAILATVIARKVNDLNLCPVDEVQQMKSRMNTPTSNTGHRPFPSHSGHEYAVIACQA
jgi:hypothetical protein